MQRSLQAAAFTTGWFVVFLIGQAQLQWDWSWGTSSQSQQWSSLHIVSSFDGWTGNTIVQLSDGSFWIQAGFAFEPCLTLAPRVRIENGQMWVEDCNEDYGVSVRRIWNVKEVSILRISNAYHGKPIITLSDGSQWVPSLGSHLGGIRAGEDCFLFYDYGWKLHCDGEVLEVDQMTQSAAQSCLLKLVNASSETIFACIALLTPSNGWESRGWYQIEPYQFIVLDLGSYQGTVYLYAEAPRTKAAWYDSNAGVIFCIHTTQAFNIPFANVIACPAPEYKQVPMIPLSVTSGINTFRFLE